MGGDGSIYFADSIQNRVLRVAPALPWLSYTDLGIPAEDASKIYFFNSAGKHLRTLDALKGSVRRKTVTTLDNKGRVIESQVPEIIPVQYSYDSRGRLGSITQGTRNYAFSYDADGNLASTTDPMLRTAGFEYDAAGRVTC